jgi:hypothetical protein
MSAGAAVSPKSPYTNVYVVKYAHAEPENASKFAANIIVPSRHRAIECTDLMWRFMFASFRAGQAEARSDDGSTNRLTNSTPKLMAALRQL